LRIDPQITQTGHKKANEKRPSLDPVATARGTDTARPLTQAVLT